MAEDIRIAYLVSRYPALNHTFILREIVGLRAEGFDIGVFAIWGADRPRERMTAIERQESDSTFAVLPVRGRFLRAQIATLFARPLGYWRGAAQAIQLAKGGFGSYFFHLIYFLEAVAAGHAAARAGYRHVHSHFSSTVALIAARIFGFSLSLTIHGPDEFRDVERFGMRRKVTQSRFIAAISHYGRSQIMWATDPADWRKIEVCRLGVDPDVFAPAGRRTGSDAFRVICVGRLAPVKAQEILIAACARLARCGRNVILHLVGGGPDEDRLKCAASAAGMEASVVFEGARNQDEVIALYRRADVFAMASFAEGIPVVLMEAMAMEIPCVATWVNGIPELIVPEREGLLLAPSDEEGLADAIARLMDDPELRRRIGVAAREKIRRNYDLARNISHLAAAFRRHLATRQR